MTPIDETDDMRNLTDWQRTKDPAMFANLMIRYQPVVNQVVNKYRTVGVSPSTLKAHATSQMIKAFQSYDPTKGTQPTTHIWNNLQKVQRVAAESLSSGHIPEQRNLKRATFITTRDNLKDRIGYDPSAADMADELGWNINEVSRMNAEATNEISASSMQHDFYTNSSSNAGNDKELVDYLYQKADPKDRVVLEHTFGFGGKPVLNNKKLAEKLGTNEMFVGRAKKRLSEQMRSYR